MAGRRRRAQVYVLDGEEAPPTMEYLAAIWAAYERHGFDLGPLVAAVNRALGQAPSGRTGSSVTPRTPQD